MMTFYKFQNLSLILALVLIISACKSLETRLMDASIENGPVSAFMLAKDEYDQDSKNPEKRTFFETYSQKAFDFRIENTISYIKSGDYGKAKIELVTAAFSAKSMLAMMKVRNFTPKEANIISKLENDVNTFQEKLYFESVDFFQKSEKNTDIDKRYQMFQQSYDMFDKVGDFRDANQFKQVSSDYIVYTEGEFALRDRKFRKAYSIFSNIINFKDASLRKSEALQLGQIRVALAPIDNDINDEINHNIRKALERDPFVKIIALGTLSKFAGFVRGLDIQADYGVSGILNMQYNKNTFECKDGDKDIWYIHDRVKILNTYIDSTNKSKKIKYVEYCPANEKVSYKECKNISSLESRFFLEIINLKNGESFYSDNIYHNEEDVVSFYSFNENKSLEFISLRNPNKMIEKVEAKDENFRYAHNWKANSDDKDFHEKFFAPRNLKTRRELEPYIIDYMSNKIANIVSDAFQKMD